MIFWILTLLAWGTPEGAADNAPELPAAFSHFSDVVEIFVEGKHIVLRTKDMSHSGQSPWAMAVYLP